jgi:hypothetical protein
MTPRKQRGKIRRTNIYTKGEDQKDKYIYTIRLNSMTPRKQRGKIRRTNIYTKGKDQTDKYIYYKIEQLDSSKTKGEDQTDKYIY